MAQPRCLRCGQAFEPTSARQDHCTPCGVEVAELIAIDERRRQPRFTVGKDLTSWGAR